MVNPPPSSAGGSGVSAFWRNSTRNVPPYWGRVAPGAAGWSSAAASSRAKLPPRAPKQVPTSAQGRWRQPAFLRFLRVLRFLLAWVFSALVSASPRLRVEIDSLFGSGSAGFGGGFPMGASIFNLPTAVHRNQICLVAPGGEVADHGKCRIAAKAPERRDRARQIERRPERDGRPVDQPEGAYRIGLTGLAGLGREDLRASAAMRLGFRQVAAPGRDAAHRVERGVKNLRTAIEHGQQPILAPVLFGGCGGEERGQCLADAVGRGPPSIEVIPPGSEARQQHAARARIQGPGLVAGVTFHGERWVGRAATGHAGQVRLEAAAIDPQMAAQVARPGTRRGERQGLGRALRAKADAGRRQHQDPGAEHDHVQNLLLLFPYQLLFQCEDGSGGRPGGRGALPGGDPDLAIVALAGFFHDQKLRQVAGDGEPGVDHGLLVGQASWPVLPACGRFFLAGARAGFAQSGIESHASLVEITGGERGEVTPTDRYRLSAPCKRNGFPRQFANGAGHIVSGPSVPRQEDQQCGEDRGALHARDHSTSRRIPPLEWDRPGYPLGRLSPSFMRRRKPRRKTRARRNEMGSETAAIRIHAIRFSMVVSPYWPAGSLPAATSDGTPKRRAMSGLRSS